MAYYNLKKKPSLTTKEGETETMYADIVYSGTITAKQLIRAVAKRTGFKEGMIEGILSELRDETLDYLGEGFPGRTGRVWILLRQGDISFGGGQERLAFQLRFFQRGELPCF